MLQNPLANTVIKLRSADVIVTFFRPNESNAGEASRYPTYAPEKVRVKQLRDAGIRMVHNLFINSSEQQWNNQIDCVLRQTLEESVSFEPLCVLQFEGTEKCSATNYIL